jgi:hypothetical protein
MSSASPATPTKRATKTSVKKIPAASIAEDPIAATEPNSDAAPTKKPRAPRKSAAAKVAAPNEAEPAKAPEPPKKTATPRKRKNAGSDEPEAAAASTAAPDAAAEPEKKAKKPREAKPKTVYIEGYGDLNKEDAERDYTEEEYLRWREATALRASSQKFKEWQKSKRAFYKNLKTLTQSRKRKRQLKPVDNALTTNTHYDRIMTNIPKEEFSILNNAWLSGHGFDGIVSAETINSGDLSGIVDGAQATYTVYRAAVANGFKPLGIVSENRKKNADNNSLEYVHKTTGERVYVGIALPFRKVEASKFSISPKDRKYLAEAAGDESETLE